MSQDTDRKRALTKKELTVAVNNLGQSMNHLANALATDISQIMGVLSGILSHMGLLQEFTCPHCGTNLNHPKLEGVEPPTHCPACNGDMGEEPVLEEE
jgi:rubrerythrin